MPLTQAQLVTEVRSLLNEATAAFYTDVQIQNWLQQGARDLSLKTRCVEADATISVVTSTLNYAVPTDAFVIHSILNAATGIALTKILPPKAGHIVDSASAAIPLYWWLFNDKIWLTPLASGSSTLTVLYSKTTETVTDIPDEYRIELINYATSRALIRNEQAIEALAVMNMYNNHVQFARLDVIERGTMSIDELTLPDTKLRPQAQAG